MGQQQNLNFYGFPWNKGIRIMCARFPPLPYKCAAPRFHGFSAEIFRKDFRGRG